MKQTIERGQLLFQQGRYDLALQEFHRALGDDPQDPVAHAFVALCLAEQKSFVDASESAARAITSAPDMPFAHYVAAHVFHQRNRFKEAERAIDEATRLDPYNSSYHGLAAHLRIAASDWRGALARATKGLEVDADDATCLNARAIALVKLGRVGHAQSELQSSLERDPENSITHANLGWAALERGERNQALESFRESLRINPNLDWARDGMIHALKLRYPLYGLFLRYLLWMQRLGGRLQMAVIIGAFVGYQILNGVARTSPKLRPWLMPLLVAYFVFAYLTWVARPITNLVLRLNRFGRAILDPIERRESNLIAAALFGAIISGACYFHSDRALPLYALIICAAIAIPLSRVYHCAEGWPTRLMAGYTIGMALLGVAAFSFGFLSIRFESDRLAALAVNSLNLYVLAAVGSQFAANALGMVRPTR